MQFWKSRQRKLNEAQDQIDRDYLADAIRTVRGVEMTIVHLEKCYEYRGYTIGLVDPKLPVVVRIPQENVTKKLGEPARIVFTSAPDLTNVFEKFKKLENSIDNDDARTWAAIAYYSKVEIYLPSDYDGLWPYLEGMHELAEKYFD